MTTDSIQRGQIVSRYITGAPSEADAIAAEFPDIITSSAKLSRAEWLEVPAEWLDYAAQYGPDEALTRAREAGGFGV